MTSKPTRKQIKKESAGPVLLAEKDGSQESVNIRLEKNQLKEQKETNSILIVNTILTGLGSLAGLAGTIIAIYLLL